MNRAAGLPPPPLPARIGPCGSVSYRSAKRELCRKGALAFLVQTVLGHMGVEVPRDTNPGIRWVPASKAMPPHASASRSPRGQCGSHRRGENVVTITSIQPRSTNSARAMMHSARDLQTGLRIDLAIQIGSAIEPVLHAHAQVTADQRPGTGPGLL